MWAFNRTNPAGLKYTLIQVNNERTEIRLRGPIMKSIIVSHNIHRVCNGWYDWIIRNMFLHDAFSFLTPDEREFIQSGQTVAEMQVAWNDALAEKKSNPL